MPIFPAATTSAAVAEHLDTGICRLVRNCDYPHPMKRILSIQCPDTVVGIVCKLLDKVTSGDTEDVGIL